MIGVVYTPLHWAKWLVRQSGAYDAWIAGARVFEPSFGSGSFIDAFLSIARDSEVAWNRSDLARISGYEISKEASEKTRQKLARKYGPDTQALDLRDGDYLFSDDFNRDFDYVVGNPPWSNFNNLPVSYKEKIKSSFLKYGVVKRRGDVLLGASRADIAALFLAKTVQDQLRPNGRAALFLPSSIFFNDGAHNEIWPRVGSQGHYSIERFWDFPQGGVFDGIGTRYCAVKLARGTCQSASVPLDSYKDGSWSEASAAPFDGKSGPWQHVRLHQSVPFTPVKVKQSQSPRQGVNTCGANDIYILNSVLVSGKIACGINGSGETVIVEAELLHPLAGRHLGLTTTRFILLPHDHNSGRPMSFEELKAYPLVLSYLKAKKVALEGRKGVMIQTHIKKGLWWALLGVGPYSFSAWKVMWGALGVASLEPHVIPGKIQGNQAMHAYIPCDDLEDATRIAGSLKSPAINESLKLFGTSGTCNFAQPGRVKRYLQFQSNEPLLC